MIIVVTSVEVDNHSFPDFVEIMIDEPSDGVGVNMWKGYANRAHLGDSGIIKDPTARMTPIIHCMSSGNLHAISDSMNEQK